MERNDNLLERKKARKKRKLFKKRHWILVAIGIYLVAFFSIQAYQIYDLKKQQNNLKVKIEKLEIEKRELEVKYSNINNLEYIEEMARENLRMVKPNEVLYVDPTLEKEGYEEKQLND